MWGWGGAGDGAGYLCVCGECLVASFPRIISDTVLEKKTTQLCKDVEDLNETFLVFQCLLPMLGPSTLCSSLG